MFFFFVCYVSAISDTRNLYLRFWTKVFSVACKALSEDVNTSLEELFLVNLFWMDDACFARH